MGFNLPLDAWLRGELRDTAEDLLLGERSAERGYFSLDFVQQLFDEHLAGRWDWHRELWTLMMLEMWQREFMDQEPAIQPAASATRYLEWPRAGFGTGASVSPVPRAQTT